MRRMLWAVTGAVLLAALAAGVVFALNYEGEDFCQDSPAWPNGTYLGQMHPYHSDFYRGYAERRGWDPCETWAQDQRNSAIRGLRELGYTVTAPVVLTEADKDLRTGTQAIMWLSVTNSDSGHLEVQIYIPQTTVVLPRSKIAVNLFAGRRHLGEFCNSGTVFGAEWSANFSCAREDASHTEVTRATVSIASASQEYRCERNEKSTADATFLACAFR